MSVMKLFIAASVISLIATNVYAQEQSEDRNITIEREYKPVIQDAGKITSLPEILNLNITKERVDYADFYEVLPFNKDLLLLSSAELDYQRKIISEDAVLQTGIGIWNSFARFGLPIIKKADSRLDFNVNHSGIFGDKQHAITEGSLIFSHFFPQLELYAGMSLSHEFFNYYGTNYSGGSNQPINLVDFQSGLTNPFPVYTEKQSNLNFFPTRDFRLDTLTGMNNTDVLWRMQMVAGIRSLPDKSGYNQHAELKYNRFSSMLGLQEHQIKTSFGISRENGKNRIGVDFELNNLFYRIDGRPVANFWDYYAVLAMNPYYLITRDNWYVRAGIKASFSFIHGRPFSPMPDFAAEWKAIPDVLALYGGITGEYTLSTLNKTYEENPWVFPTLRIRDQYTPINAYMGIKVKALHNLLIDAFADYRYLPDQYFFVNKSFTTDDISGDSSTLYLNKFDVIYQNAGLFRVGMRAAYNIRNLVNLQAKFTYNGWNMDNVHYGWLKPDIEATFNADVRLTRKISTSVNVYYEGIRYAKLGEGIAGRKSLAPYTDINLAISYAFSKQISSFFRLNNLLNSHYEHFYGYEVQGINFLMGGTLSF